MKAARVVLAALAVIAAAACAKQKTARPAAVATKSAATSDALPPLTISLGKQTLVVERRRALQGASFVRAIRLDERTLFPASCGEAPALPVLCGPAFEAMEGHATYDTQLVDWHESGGVATLVLATRIEGSGECGAYGFWVLRVDGTGPRASAPFKGCFSYARDPALDATDWSPSVAWGPPLGLSVHAQSGSVRRVKLDEGTFEWVP